MCITHLCLQHIPGGGRKVQFCVSLTFAYSISLEEEEKPSPGVTLTFACSTHLEKGRRSPVLCDTHLCPPRGPVEGSRKIVLQHASNPVNTLSDLPPGEGERATGSRGKDPKAWPPCPREAPPGGEEIPVFKLPFPFSL